MDDAVPVCETDSGSDFSDQTSDENLLGAAGFYLKSGSALSLNDEPVVEILDSSKIVESMNKTITDIADIIGEDLTVTRLLLSHFKWDSQAFTERYACM